MEKKKLKLTISGSSKKTISNIELAKSQAKNSVVIEKKTKRFGPKSSFPKKNFQKSTFNKPSTNFIPRESVNSKKSFGGTSFENIKKMITKYKKLK